MKGHCPKGIFEISVLGKPLGAECGQDVSCVGKVWGRFLRAKHFAQHMW